MKQGLFLGLWLLSSVVAVAAPFEIGGSLSADEDATLAQRYGADYSPQTEAGKKAGAAAIQAAAEAASNEMNAATPTASSAPCLIPTWTARAMCQNNLRDRIAALGNFPWMDLIHDYDAKVLQAAVDADAQRIEKDELLAKMNLAADEFQKAVAQRNQGAQAQPQAQQAAREGQIPIQQRPVRLPPSATNCSKVGDIVNCTTD